MAAVSLAVLLSACAVTPDPYTQAQFEARAAADRESMFAGQEPLTAPLSLEEAFSRVLKYNLDRRSKMMEEALALGQTDLDRFELWPKIPTSAGYTGRSEPNATVSQDLRTQTTTNGHTYSTDRGLFTADLGLTWNILDFGVSYFTAQQNADRALIATERRRKAVANLAQDVRFAYWRAAAAQVLGDKVRSVIDDADLALSDAERVEAERLRDPTEVLRIQKTLLESVRQLESIDQELRVAKAELAALINVPPGSDVRLAVVQDAPLDIPLWKMPIAEMEERALANNPDLREQDYESRIAVDETRKEILRILPGVTFSLSRQYDSNSFLAANRWSEAGAKLSWNLINVLSAPDRINYTETREDVAEAKRLALRMAILAQVHVGSHRFDSAVRQFERADKLWRVERRLADASANQQAGGTANDIERISNATSAVAAELRRYQTYAEAQSAFGNLQTTVGMDPLPATVAANAVEAAVAGFGGRLPAGAGQAAGVPESDVAGPDVAETMVSPEEAAPGGVPSYELDDVLDWVFRVSARTDSLSDGNAR